MYKIDIEEFQGPLELLNHLIEKNKIDIYDIPISEITNQYIEYIEKMEEFNLELTSEFIVIASNLIEIKSRMLLPKVVEEEDPREELVTKILEYRKYKLASEQMRDRFDIYSKVYFKLKDDFDYLEQDEELNFDMDLLVKSFKRIINDFEKRNAVRNDDEIERLTEDLKKDEYSVEEGMTYITKKLLNNSAITFDSLFDTMTTKYRIITIFMSMLELIKRRDINVVQENTFGEIVIYKSNQINQID